MITLEYFPCHLVDVYVIVSRSYSKPSRAKHRASKDNYATTSILTLFVDLIFDASHLSFPRVARVSVAIYVVSGSLQMNARVVQSDIKI